MLENLLSHITSSLLEVSNLSLPSDPPTPPTKTSEALRRNLQAVNSQLASMKKAWDEEKRQLLGEKAVLQDATNRLNMQVRDANYKLTETERVGERVRASVQEVSKPRVRLRIRPDCISGIGQCKTCYR